MQSKKKKKLNKNFFFFLIIEIETMSQNTQTQINYNTLKIEDIKENPNYLWDFKQMTKSKHFDISWVDI